MPDIAKTKRRPRTDAEPQPVPRFIPPLDIHAENALDPPPPGTEEWLRRRAARLLAALQITTMRADGKKLQ